MRQNTDRLVGLQRALNKSVQGAKADTFVEIPPQLLSVAELPGSHKAFNNAVVGVDQFDSFRRQDSFSVAGVTAGQVTNGPVLTPGLWHIQGFAQLYFTGTGNQNNDNNLGLLDVDGATGTFILWNRSNQPGSFIDRFEVNISLLFRAQVVFAQAQTIGGDVSKQFFSALFNKLI